MSFSGGRTDTAKEPGATASIGTSTAQLVAANPNRVAIYISNGHATQVAWVSLGSAAAVANEGIKIPPGEGGPVKIDEFTGPIQIIASGATTPVGYTEI